MMYILLSVIAALSSILIALAFVWFRRPAWVVQSLSWFAFFTITEILLNNIIKYKIALFSRDQLTITLNIVFFVD